MKYKYHNFICGLVFGLGITNTAYANPNGASYDPSQVSISNLNATTLEITNSNGAIINWQQFSIQHNEITRFIQDSANSAVLNRVVGEDPSAILGQLLSNGRVFLINPNGIAFGPDAVIDTAGLVASTLDMTDEDFINENLKFQGTNAADISNQGYIKAGANGDIFLIAPNIENSGVIETDGGQIILAAGESITIASLDSEHIVFDVQAPANEVVNLGEIITHGGAASMFAGSITQDGSINANSISVDKNGNIQLYAKADINISSDAVMIANGANGGEIKIESETGTIWNAGTIEAKGDIGEGGRVEVLGERVALIDAASIDASGETGGGEVLVGGDYQGKNDAIKNARKTFLGEDTSIKADAVTNGDGGKVIVWADETTQAYGRISARGGSEFGDGGFSEVSGKQYLDYQGLTDLRATNGHVGTLLLDPTDINIVAGGTATADTEFSGGVFQESGVIDATSEIIMSNLITQLGLADITINTNSSAGSVGDINLNTTLDFDGIGAARTLTFIANNDLNILNPILDSSAGGESLSLIFNTGGVTNINADISTGGGLIDAQTSGSGIVGFSGTRIINSDLHAKTLTIDSTDNVTFNGTTNIDSLIHSSGTLAGTGVVTVNTNWTPTSGITINGSLVLDTGINEALNNKIFNGSGKITNKGILDITTSGIFFTEFNNDGILNLNSGTLSLVGTGVHTGDFNLAAGSVLQFSNNANTFNSGSDTAGAGDIAFNGSSNYTFNAGSSYMISGDTGMTASTGNVVFNINAVTNTLTHFDGILSGTGSLTTTGWTPTTATVDIASLVLGVGYSGTLSGLLTVSGSGTITNQGALTLGGATINPNFVNQGSLLVTGGGSTLAGTATQNSGTMLVNAGSMLTTASLNINGGVLHGDGTVNGAVNHSGGTVSAGNILGTLNITGNYVQTAGATLQADLGGATSAGVDYDLLNVTGTASLAGTLDIQLVNGFSGNVSEKFDVINAANITGDFTSINTPSTHAFTNSANVPSLGNYQLEISSITADTTTTTNTATTDASSANNTVSATDNILVLNNFQDELNKSNFAFQENEFNSSEEDEEEKRVLACR